jgi:hypothetical protein
MERHSVGSRSARLLIDLHKTLIRGLLFFGLISSRAKYESISATYESRVFLAW